MGGFRAKRAKRSPGPCTRSVWRGRIAPVKTTLASHLRLWRAASALVLAWLVSMATARADEREAFLAAIHHLENPRDLTRPGAHGELGAYQFRSTTWQMHTAIPFRQALNRATSDAVAIKHYEWIKQRLEVARVPATDYNIALAWNGGVSAAVRGRAPVAAHKYAQRAVNLVSAYVPPTKPAATMVAAVETPPVIEAVVAEATPVSSPMFQLGGNATPEVEPLFRLGAVRRVADAR